MMKRKKAAKVGLFITGFILFLLGIIMPQLWKDLLLEIFYQQQLALRPGSLSYNRWKLTEDPMKTSFYLWNWTNPEQINDENVKPHFVEMGPYVFWQVREKVDVTFNDENGTITYRDKWTFYYDSALSNGSLNDKVTSVNVIAATAAYMTRTWSRFLVSPLSLVLRSNKQQVWWTKTVDELLFQGFDNPILKLSSYVPGLEMPEKFAYMYGINNTVQPDVINMDTEANDISKIGQIYFLNYKNESDAFPNCKEIEGSMGDFFPPSATPETSLLFYIPQLCRRVSYYFHSESTYKGMKTYLFAVSHKTVEDDNPEVKCYCQDIECPPTGNFDSSTCQKGAPMSSSMPHFALTDPYYNNAIEGMNPDENKHRESTMLEPITGIQVRVNPKFQVNVRLTRNPSLQLFRSVPDVYLPLFWQETDMVLEERYIWRIWLLVFFLLNGCQIWYGVSGAGFVTAMTVLIYHLRNRKSLKRKNRNLQNGTEVEKKTEQSKTKTQGEIHNGSVTYVFTDDKPAILD